MLVGTCISDGPQRQTSWGIPLPVVRWRWTEETSTSVSRVDGGPTGVVDAGNGDFSLSWSEVQSEVVEFVRLCTYEWAGYGCSSKSPGTVVARSHETRISVVDETTTSSGGPGNSF